MTPSRSMRSCSYARSTVLRDSPRFSDSIRVDGSLLPDWSWPLRIACLNERASCSCLGPWLSSCRCIGSTVRTARYVQDDEVHRRDSHRRKWPLRFDVDNLATRSAPCAAIATNCGLPVPAGVWGTLSGGVPGAFAG